MSWIKWHSIYLFYFLFNTHKICTRAGQRNYQRTSLSAFGIHLQQQQQQQQIKREEKKLEIFARNCRWVAADVVVVEEAPLEKGESKSYVLFVSLERQQ